MTATNDLKNLFAAASKTTTGGFKQLNMTGQLTHQAETMADEVLKSLKAEDQPLVERSMTDHATMDKLLNDRRPSVDTDHEFLAAISADELEKMLKSQQSKRSRSKSKTMTLDNYKVMMTGAFAERLIRAALGKPKDAGHLGAKRKDVGYSDDEYAQLAEDQEQLAKAIRNVQSKKSIAKTKADFDESSDRWQQLLDVERKLKSLRVGGSNQFEEALATVEDIDNLSAKDAKALLLKLKQLTK